MTRNHDDDHHEHEHANHYSDMEARMRALETLLIHKGLIDPAAIEAIVDTYETKVGPRNGAAVVARSWCDPAFAKWLVRDATSAIASLGFGERHGTRMRAVFNTARVHNMIVCTLCSCYPWAVLGLPPVWYKSPAYRSRAVIDPRSVLAEFGVVLPEEKLVRVWDSTAELRYLVIPERPIGSEDMTERELAAVVSRDAMIGTALVMLQDRVR
ncbi:nitrile hydratase subunit alpha [Neorhizobium sp. Rsf11]|uniref:nitrile hydratase n=2 Tax=Neorhizobium TaxID=1525371 RepID=A0ABV0MCG5_9HYPH|nr:nitrile hydratase subunit alpha [Neorhizobium petrolearium]MCC2613722.1 nitrile hydratase subunit alpha [Neorhizobium petrolearium]WGI72034.1 nitrile hydratase subunit alpha [Neorhizobium petrolearium]